MELTQEQFDLIQAKVDHMYDMNIITPYEKGKIDKYFKELKNNGGKKVKLVGTNDYPKIKKTIKRLIKEVSQ